MTTSPITNAATAATAAPSPASPDQAKLKKAAQAFEAVFVRQLIGSMRSAGGEGEGLFDSEATKQFQDMADAKTADAMAQKGALHIADMLVKQYGARLSGSAAAAGTQPAPAVTASDGKAGS